MGITGNARVCGLPAKKPVQETSNSQGPLHFPHRGRQTAQVQARHPLHRRLIQRPLQGNAADQDFWEKQLPLAGGYDRYAFLSDYGDFLVQQKPAAMKTAMPTLKAFALYGEAWYERYAAAAAIYAVMQEYRLILAPEDASVKEADRSGVILTPNERTEYTAVLETLTQMLDTIKREEKSESVRKRYKAFE